MGNHQSYAAKNVGASTNKGFETNKTDGLDMIFHEEIEEKVEIRGDDKQQLGGCVCKRRQSTSAINS
jgi:hypothetical protein